MKHGLIIYSLDSSFDSSLDSLNVKSSLIAFTIFLSFIAYLHSSKSIWGYFLFELTKIESNNTTDKYAQYWLTFGILLCSKFVYTLSF